jgi:hypothetical protein
LGVIDHEAWTRVEIPGSHILNAAELEEETYALSDDVWDWLIENCGELFDDVRLTGSWTWDVFDENIATFWFAERSPASLFKLTWG